MPEKTYLLDSVTVSKLTGGQLASDFVTSHCVVPEEIAYELERVGKDTDVLRISQPVDIDLLASIREVLSMEEIGYRLLDLFNNSGNGDIVLLALALCGIRDTRAKLFGPGYTIVTDDEALIEFTKKRMAALTDGEKVETLRTEEFISLLDNSLL